MQITFINNMVKSVQNKVYSLRMKYRKPSYSMEIKEPVDIEHATIQLTQQAKYVDVYYNASAVVLLQKIITLSNKYTADHSKFLTPAMSTIETYVNGWAEMKEITTENLGYLSFNVERSRTGITQYASELKLLGDSFDHENASDIMVDHVRLSLYTYTTEFPYRRAYNALLKKSSMKLEPLHGFIMANVEMLDKLIKFLDILYAGWEKCGKTKEFEEFRNRQVTLISTIHDFVDIIEMDIHLCESFLHYGTTPLNFKVYPVIRKK